MLQLDWLVLEPWGASCLYSHFPHHPDVLQMCAAMPGFHMGTKDQSSGPHVCMALWAPGSVVIVFPEAAFWVSAYLISTPHANSKQPLPSIVPAMTATDFPRLGRTGPRSCHSSFEDPA